MTNPNQPWDHNNQQPWDPNAQHGAHLNGPGPYQQGPMGAPQQPGADNDGFFKALFDLSFDRYVTPSVTKVLYILAMVGVGLVSLSMLFTSLRIMQDSALLGLFTLLFVPITFIAGLALTRVSLEVTLAVIRIAQDVRRLR